MKPLCEHCKAEDNSVTPENGVWTLDVNGNTVPVHSTSIQTFLTEQSIMNPAFSKHTSAAQLADDFSLALTKLNVTP